MEGRVDFTSLDRSRILGAGLTPGALGPLAPSFPNSEAGHHALSRLGASAAAAGLNGVPELTRSGSPPSLAALQSQYTGRYPGSALHSPSASYAMMTGYLASGYIPESLKNLVPDVQQCCTSPHPEGYARYLINNMYYPYLPYLPATESLSLFAQNSATAQAQAAAHHRIYDLHKEAIFGPSSATGGFFPSPLLLSQSGQLEATNLSMSNSSKSKQSDRPHALDGQRKSSEQPSKQNSSNLPASSGKSDIQKKCLKPELKTVSSAESDKRTTSSKDSKDTTKSSDHKTSSKLHKDISLNKETHPKDKRTLTEKHSQQKVSKTESVCNRKAEFPSPHSYESISNHDKRSRKIYSPIDVQDKPENLCVKDRVISPVSTCVRTCVRTQSVVTDTTVTVTSTLNVDSLGQRLSPGQAGQDSKTTDNKQISPSSSADTTNTTYSLPYYHNLYFRPSSIEGKKVHAVTYVPEVGTVPSPMVASSSTIEDTVKVSKDDVITKPADDKSEKSKDTDKPCSSIPINLKASPKRNKQLDLSAPRKVDERKSKTSKRLDSSVVVKSKVKQDSDTQCLKKPSESQNGTKEVTKKCMIQSTNDTTVEKSRNEPLEVKKCNERLCDRASDKESLGCQKSKHDEERVAKSEAISLPSPIQPNDKDVNEVEKEKENCISLTQSDASKKAASKYTTEGCPSRKMRRKENKDGLKRADTKCARAKVDTSVCDMNHNSSKIKCVEEEDSRQETRILINTRPGSAPPDTPLSKIPEKQTKEEQCKEPIKEPSTTPKGPVKDGNEDLPSTGPNIIPVGIAVARQRTAASKSNNERDPKDKRPEQSLTETKPIGGSQRPLKIIRPSTKTTSHVSSAQDPRNELPANLIVTGGGGNSSGMFWPDDPASRQLAAQFIQPSGHPINNPNWFNSSQLTFPPATPTSGTSETNQFPLTVPAGYKLAQDSLTGQILLIPSGADMFDPGRIWNGFPLGHVQSHTAFPQSILAGQQPQGALPQPQPFFTGQQPIPDRPNNVEFTVPQYQTVFNPTILPRTETTIKEEKCDTDAHCESTPGLHVAISTVAEMPQTISSVDVSHPPEAEKDKLVAVAQPAFVADMTLAAGQQCTYHSMPFVFNPAIVPVQNLTESTPDANHAKPDLTAVQSRGTSPMIPATDSNDENEECHSHSENMRDEKSEEIYVCDEKETSQRATESVPTEAKNKIPLQTQSILDKVTGQEQKYQDILEDENTTVENHENNKAAENLEEILNKNSNVDVQSESKTGAEKVADGDSKRTSNNLDNELCKNDPCPGLEVLKAIPDVSLATVSSSAAKETPTPEYNPYTDPLVLQAADGLELLSALAEKRSICSKGDIENKKCDIPQKTEPVETKLCDKSKSNCDDVYTFREEQDQETVSLKSPLKHEKGKTTLTPTKSVKEKEKPKSQKPRIKCGYAFKPTKPPAPVPCSPTKYTTFLGITIPEDDDVIDTIELEMRMRLAELQRRYKDKQRELAKLKPKKEKEEKTGEGKRGPGRPRKRKHCSGDSTDGTSDSQLVKPKPNKKEHTSCKKKKLAEMLVDRVFRKTGSSFKIPLSKKTNLIAPARIELPGGKPPVEKVKSEKSSSPVDFGKLIKRSRLSQLNGKDRSFVGGLWRRKEEKRKFENSLLTTAKQKKIKQSEGFSSESGLSLLAEYASKEEKKKKKRPSEGDKKEVVDVKEASSPESPTKKRKPGRPKKCDSTRPGVTETLVAKQSKHIDFFRWQQIESSTKSSPPPTQPEPKTTSLELYLDEWNLRRSERIFLSDPSPQTSPKQNPISPPNRGAKSGETSMKGTTEKKQRKTDAQKIQHSKNIHELSQKLKKKYSKGLNQKSREKTTELLKASREKLTFKRHKQKLAELKKRRLSSSDSEGDDIPLSALRAKACTPEPQTCIIDKDELRDGMRILIFMDGLFHEGAVKAIRPPDVYGAILDNERRTRPHICSQEEILRDTIKDVKPASGHVLPEGTRICAYWSQQFSCLYPGTISRASPNPDSDKSLVNVEFDDGDSGKIPLDHIRLIPQDFPLVEYDPNPLLLLTKRRRTTTSESSDTRRSVSDITSPVVKEKEPRDPTKPKRGPGRPPKIRVPTEDEEVFSSETNVDTEKNKSAIDSETKKISKSSPSKETKSDESKQINGDSVNPKKAKNDSLTAFASARQLWKWSGKSTKRPGLKGKAKKEYYKSIVRGRETLTVGECAVFLSTGRPNLPYVGRIESLWEGWGGQMVVKVKWFYHPEETKGGKRLQNMKGALFRSDHEDENDVQTISHKCEVLPFHDYKRRKDVISHDANDDVYYLAGSYQPTIGHIKFEPGVIT